MVDLLTDLLEVNYEGGFYWALHGKKFEVADFLIKKGKLTSETELEIGCRFGPEVISFLKKRNLSTYCGNHQVSH